MTNVRLNIAYAMSIVITVLGVVYASMYAFGGPPKTGVLTKLPDTNSMALETAIGFVLVGLVLSLISYRLSEFDSLDRLSTVNRQLCETLAHRDPGA